MRGRLFVALAMHVSLVAAYIELPRISVVLVAYAAALYLGTIAPEND